MARSLNGSTDLINCSSATILNPNGVGASMTACVWAYPTSFPNPYNLVIARSDAATHYYEIGPKSTGKLAVYYVDNAGNSRDYDGTGSNTLVANTWYHLAFTIPAAAGGFARGFVNGALDGTAGLSGTGGITSIAQPTCLGSDNHASSFAGRLAHGAIWANVVLTAGELLALANGALPYTIRPGSLVGYWPLDGLQSPEPDLSGNVNNGTLTGTALAAGPPVMQFTPRWHRYLGWTPMLPAAGLGWIINRRNKLMVPKKRA